MQNVRRLVGYVMRLRKDPPLVDHGSDRFLTLVDRTGTSAQILAGG
jgi:hypothetical protein